MSARSGGEGRGLPREPPPPLLGAVPVNPPDGILLVCFCVEVRPTSQTAVWFSSSCASTSSARKKGRSASCECCWRLVCRSNSRMMSSWSSTLAAGKRGRPPPPRQYFHPVTDRIKPPDTFRVLEVLWHITRIVSPQHFWDTELLKSRTHEREAQIFQLFTLMLFKQNKIISSNKI